MAIETKTYFRRLARTGVVLMMGALSVCGTAGAQAPPVTTGSVFIVPSDQNWSQIYKIAFYKGNVLALDAGNGSLYQLSPGATSWSTLVDGTAATPGIFGTGYSAIGMAIDAQGTLYFTIRYEPKFVSDALFWRVPYNASQNTWQPTASNGWGGNIFDAQGDQLYSYGSDDVEWVDNPAMDGSGTLYWMAETQNNIYSLAVDKTGNASQTSVKANAIVTGLKADQGKLAIDVNGNIYFTENRAVKNTARVNGIFFIPAGTTGLTGTGDGDVEATLQRIDAPTNTIVYGGVTLDAAGNLYLASENNPTYDETFNGVWMIPNECGSPSKVTSPSCLNFNHISLLAPVGSNNAIAIDPRGYLWIPSYDDWTPNGSGPYPGEWAIVVWAPGSLNLGVSGNSPTILSLNPNFGVAGSSVTISGANFGAAQGTSTVLFNNQTSTTTITSWSPTSIVAVVPPDATTGNVVVIVGALQSNGVNFTLGSSGSGTAGPSGTVFVTFNQAVTPGSIQYSQTAGGTDFAAASANPNPPQSGTPAVPCTAATAYTAQSSCQIWVALNARAPGAVSGQVTMLDSSNNMVQGSKVYLSGTGQGAEAAMLDSPMQTAIASGLQSPAQVAADSLGDTYLADSGLKKVLYFPANSSSATGTSIGSGLVAPTGVAVDGSGDVYIADSGNVIEIPAVNGVLNTAGQAVVASGLGKDLNLAVDGVGNVYVADPNNSRVVKIPNPATANLIPNGDEAGINASTTITVGSGFNQPSAIAMDSSGDLFVADGSTLYEVTPESVQTPITTSLAGSVTGLAVDASGSVLVSESGGILRIPSISGTLSVNSAGSLDSTITAPTSVALDQTGNLYVSDMTNSTPNLFELAVTGLVNFGVGLTPTVLTQQDVPLFDIGNEPLTLTGNPTFSGNDAADFSVVASNSGTACDTTGATPVATGSSCTLGIGFTPPTKGAYSGDSMTVPTNAGNVPAGDITAALEGQATANLEPTQTAVSLNPATTTYPGGTTVTVTVTPEPTSTTPPNTNIPSGPVTLTVACTAVGCTQQPITQTGTASGTDAGTTATFNLTGIEGGGYSVTAQYGGNVAQLMQKSTSSAVTFTVAPAAPTITLSEPLGVSPNSFNGIYYVETGQNSITLAVNVSSSLGSPSGTFTFMNGSQAVGTAPLDANGNAVFNTSTLANGSYSITAVFSGDQNFASVTSSAIAFQVIPSSVLITASPTSVSTSAGTPVASTITLQSLAGFSAPNGANIACNNSTLPYYSECTFSVPNPVICAPPGTTAIPCSGITTTVVTISSNIPVNLPPATAANVPANRPGTSPLIPAGFLGLGLFGLALRRRAIFNHKLLNSVSLALLLIGAVMGFGGCTNNSYTQQIKVPVYTTPAGTYKVSILVTDPSSGAQESLPFTIPVTIQAAQ
jgi:hypothetical protein